MRGPVESAWNSAYYSYYSPRAHLKRHLFRDTNNILAGAEPGQGAGSHVGALATSRLLSPGLMQFQAMASRGLPDSTAAAELPNPLSPSCPWAVQLQRGVFEVAALPGAPQLLQASGAWPQFVSSISEVVGVRVLEGGLKVLL